MLSNPVDVLRTERRSLWPASLPTFAIGLALACSELGGEVGETCQRRADCQSELKCVQNTCATQEQVEASNQAAQKIREEVEAKRADLESTEPGPLTTAQGSDSSSSNHNVDPDMAARAAGAQGQVDAPPGFPDSAWPGLYGGEIGEAYGVSGLGLVQPTQPSASKNKPKNTSAPRARSTKKTTVRQGKAKVQGALDKSIIRRIVRAHINEVVDCADGLDSEGRVAVAFVIAGTGKVGSSVVQESTLKDRVVANCIARAVKRWKFPLPEDGDNVIVTYPFTLRP
ncbi:MAG: AgmX/PglI C-terminal domain-containing protein [Nannocystaceae bacterium]